MSYLDTYKAWLASPALSADEKAELEAIANDERRSKAVSSISCLSAPQVCAAPWALVCTA